MATRSRARVSVAPEKSADVRTFENAPSASEDKLPDVREFENPTRATTADRVADVRRFEFGDAERNLATLLGLDLTASVDARVDRAVERTNLALRMVIEAGLDLLSVRAECQHGDFQQLLGERGMPNQRAYEAMSYAKFAAGLPEAERERILSLPKSKVLELARADPEVIEDLLADEEGFESIADLTVRGLRQRVIELERKKADLETQAETLVEERDHVTAQLRDERDARIKTTDGVPVAVQDVRLECAALHHKAVASIDDLDQLIGAHVSDTGELPDEWVQPVARHLYAALTSLHARTGGLIAQLRAAHGDALDGDGTPTDLFGPQEVRRCAQMYRDLTQEHNHDAELRRWEREMERPRGKGRPRKRPV